MENNWISTIIEMDSVDWKGNTIHLKDVPAIKNAKTGKTRVYPSDVAKAEFRMLAEQYDLEPRDITLLMMLFVKPGVFKEGEVHYKYRLNKMLFYQWKEMEHIDLGETFPRDEFEPAKRGPVPIKLSDDLERLKEKGIVTLRYTKWGKHPKNASLITELTPFGLSIAKKLWAVLPGPFKEVTLKIKEQIFLLDPETIRKRVHRDFPEYKEIYVELDRD